MSFDPEPIKDILYRLTLRYLTIRPDGLLLDGQLVPSLEARILSYSGARTLYRGRKPHCRSLDGLLSIKGQRCAECPELKNCTSQVRVDLLVDRRVYRALLAYTSAQQFLIYTGVLHQKRLETDKVITRISVINRGSWGELKFELINQVTGDSQAENSLKSSGLGGSEAGRPN